MLAKRTDNFEEKNNCTVAVAQCLVLLIKAKSEWRKERFQVAMHR